MKRDEAASRMSNWIFETTGRRVYANNGIWGLTPDLELTDGYDSYAHHEDATLAMAERAELADHMIARWQLWKVAPPKPRDDDD
jgi:hypothetical protein